MPEAFTCLVKRLYSGSLNPIETRNDARIAFHTNVMIDAFLVMELKNDLMDAIRWFYAVEWMGAELPYLLMKQTDARRGRLRCFVLDKIAFDLLNNTVDSSPPEIDGPEIDAFLATGSSTAIETFWALRKAAADECEERGDTSAPKGCHYHDHPAGSPACRFTATAGKE